MTDENPRAVTGWLPVAVTGYRISAKGASRMTKPDDAPAWDGRPERPGESQWHWLRPDNPERGPEPLRWNGERWFLYNGWVHPDWMANEARWTYLGPCDAPAPALPAGHIDIAARDDVVERSFRRGWEAAREAAALVCHQHAKRAESLHAASPDGARLLWRWDHVRDEAWQIAAAIRAMEPPA